MKRILIFIGLKIVEIIKWIVIVGCIAVIFIVLCYFLKTYPKLATILLVCVMLYAIVAIGFVIATVAPDWIRSNWRKAGEIEKKWRKANKRRTK